MIANYHTHTIRCGHATGSERAYIERAIKGGIKYMGFSDHIPFADRDGKEASYRVPMAERYSYVETIARLREEYKNDIDIKIGFESEYFPLYFKEMISIAKDCGAEYLILGQHYLKSRCEASTISAYDSDSVEKLETYVSEVCEGMRTGAFSYVAHPDVINFTGELDVYLEKMKRICETSLETEIPLELNFLGIRNKRFYPRWDFWRMVGQMGCDVVYGFDAHDTEAAYDAASLEVAERKRSEYGLKVVELPKIIDIQSFSTKKA